MFALIRGAGARRDGREVDGPSDRRTALGTPGHRARHEISGQRTRAVATVYVIGIQTDGLFDRRVPNGPARAGRDARP